MREECIEDKQSLLLKSLVQQWVLKWRLLCVSAAFLRCVCNAVQDNDVQAALQRMLALESQLRETDSPQLSVPVFPSGKWFEWGVALPNPRFHFVRSLVCVNSGGQRSS